MAIFSEDLQVQVVKQQGNNLILKLSLHGQSTTLKVNFPGIKRGSLKADGKTIKLHTADGAPINIHFTADVCRVIF